MRTTCFCFSYLGFEVTLKWVPLGMEITPQLCLLEDLESKPLPTKHTLVLPMNHALKVNCFNVNMLRIDGGGAKLLLLTLSVRIPLYKEAW